MSKISPKQEDHPVDKYFRDQEANIPVSFENAHWAALQAMLQDANRDGNTPRGDHAPTDHGSAPDTGVSRFLTIVAIVMLICSTTWLLVAFQQTRQQPARQEPGGNTLPEFREDQNAPFPTNNRPLEQTIKMKNSRDAASKHSVNPNSTGTELVSDKSVTDSILGKDQLRLDSLSMLPPASAKDSLAVKPKKKKHLFW